MLCPSAHWHFSLPKGVPVNIFPLHYSDTHHLKHNCVYFLPLSEGIVLYISFSNACILLIGGYFVSGFLLLLSTQNMKVFIEGCLPLLLFLTMSSPFVVSNSHVLGSLWIIYCCIDEVFSSILLFSQNLSDTCYHVGYCWRCSGTLFSEVFLHAHKRPLNLLVILDVHKQSMCPKKSCHRKSLCHLTW